MEEDKSNDSTIIVLIRWCPFNANRIQMEMKIQDWIDKNISELKPTLFYGRYFDTITVEALTENYYLINQMEWIDLILRKDYSVKSIHFYSGSQDGISQFKDQLPFNLKFSLSRMGVGKILGQPHEIGKRGESFLYGKTPPWDRYVLPNVSLHVQFTEDENKIELVTIDSLNNSDDYLSL